MSHSHVQALQYAGLFTIPLEGIMRDVLLWGPEKRIKIAKYYLKRLHVLIAEQAQMSSDRGVKDLCTSIHERIEIISIVFDTDNHSMLTDMDALSDS